MYIIEAWRDYFLWVFQILRYRGRKVGVAYIYIVRKISCFAV